MTLSPKSLTHFIALAEEGRISLASARVHLSPSAFSRSIQSIEDDLGLQLFQRNMNGAPLTPAGEAVLVHARALVLENKRFALNLELLRRGDFDHVRIGAGPISAAIIIPKLIRETHEQIPNLLIHVEFGTMQTLIDRLDRNEIDLCLGDIQFVAAVEERYSSKKLLTMKGIVCCRKDHPLAEGGVVTARDLRSYRLASLLLNPAVDRALHACFGIDMAEKIPVAIECDDLGVLANLVAETDLIGVLPPQVFARHTQSLVALEPDDASSLYSYVHAIWPKSRILGPSTLKVLELSKAIS